MQLIVLTKTNISGVFVTCQELSYAQTVNHPIPFSQHLYKVSLSPFTVWKTEAQRDQGNCSKSLHSKTNILQTFFFFVNYFYILQDFIYLF